MGNENTINNENQELTETQPVEQTPEPLPDLSMFSGDQEREALEDGILKYGGLLDAADKVSNILAGSILGQIDSKAAEEQTLEDVAAQLGEMLAVSIYTDLLYGYPQE